MHRLNSRAPACAGETVATGADIPHSAAHPRVCGGDLGDGGYSTAIEMETATAEDGES